MIIESKNWGAPQLNICLGMSNLLLLMESLMWMSTYALLYFTNTFSMQSRHPMCMAWANYPHGDHPWSVNIVLFYFIYFCLYWLEHYMIFYYISIKTVTSTTTFMTTKFCWSLCRMVMVRDTRKNVSFCNGWCLASSCLLQGWGRRMGIGQLCGHGFVVGEFGLGGVWTCLNCLVAYVYPSLPCHFNTLYNI